MNDDVTTTVIEYMKAGGASKLGVSELNHRFAFIGVSSLNFLRLVSRLEREFAIEIKDDELAGIDTPRRLVELIESKRG